MMYKLNQYFLKIKLSNSL